MVAQAEPAFVDWPTVMRLAGAKNEEVALARMQHQRALLDCDQAWQRFWPSLTIGSQFRNHEGRLQDVVGNVFDVRKEQYTVGAGVQVDWVPGDMYYGALVVKQKALVAEHALEKARLEVLRSAAGQYFDLLAAEAAVDVWREDLLVMERYSNQLGNAVQVGTAFRSDLLKVETQQARLQLQLKRAQEQLGMAAARLAETLRLPPEAQLRPAKSDLIPMRVINSSAIGDLVSKAQLSRPEIKAMQARNEGLRREEERVRIGPRIPTLQAGYTAGGLGGGRNGSSGNFGEQQDFFVGLGWKIGPGGLFDSARQKAAATSRESGVLEMQRAKASVGRDVVEAALRSQSNEDQIQISERAVKAAEEMSSLATERQASQVGVVLEFVLAREDLARARLDRVRAVTEFNKAQQDLRCALGDASGAEFGR